MMDRQLEEMYDVARRSLEVSEKAKPGEGKL